jgi:hypothetical protein
LECGGLTPLSVKPQLLDEWNSLPEEKATSSRRTPKSGVPLL